MKPGDRGVSIKPGSGKYDDDGDEAVEITSKDRGVSTFKSILNQRRTISFARVRRSRARKEKMQGEQGSSAASSMLASPDFIHGTFHVRLFGERAFLERLCVFSPADCCVRVFADRAALMAQRPDAVGFVETGQGPGEELMRSTEFVMRLVEGDSVECRCFTEAEAAKWLKALAVCDSQTVKGVLCVYRQKKWKQRWAIFHKPAKILCLYRSRDAWARGESGSCRGHGAVQHAVPRPSPAQPFGIAIYDPDGAVWELAAESKPEFRRWIGAKGALPLFQAEVSLAQHSTA